MMTGVQLSGRRVQIAPLQVEGFGLAKRCAPEQQSEEPRLSGRHGVQDHLHLVGGPVVEESSRGHGVSLEWQTSVQTLPSRVRGGLRFGAGAVLDKIVADFR